MAQAADARGIAAIEQALEWRDPDSEGDIFLTMLCPNDERTMFVDNSKATEIEEDDSKEVVVEENDAQEVEIEEIRAEEHIEEHGGESILKPDSSDESLNDRKMILQVSSKHLMLASPVLKTMLRPSFREGQELLNTGRLELSLDDDDPVALLIFLNIIHGRNRNVPKCVDLKTFTHIAIFADKYECKDAFLLLIDPWCDALKETIPEAFNETLLSWMCISRIFGRSTELRQLTRIAIVQTTEKMETELPMVGILGTKCISFRDSEGLTLARLQMP